MALDISNLTVNSYRRENGRVGVRNHVLILPVDDISNAAAEGVARLIQGTLAIPHAYGRLQFGEDLELHFRTLIGTGANPNVAACVVVGIEPGWTQKIVADGIREDRQAGRRAFRSSRMATSKTIMDGFAAKQRSSCTTPPNCSARNARCRNSGSRRKCGESDTTTGLGSCPTVGNMYDKLICRRGHLPAVSARPRRSPGPSIICAAARRHS